MRDWSWCAGLLAHAISFAHQGSLAEGSDMSMLLRTVVQVKVYHQSSHPCAPPHPSCFFSCQIDPVLLAQLLPFLASLPSDGIEDLSPFLNLVSTWTASV